jgi:hypothetical protein
MSVVGIQHGVTEPIIVSIIDVNKAPITGLTDIKIQIRRQSDGFYFDWSDNTFKVAASVVNLWQALMEVSAVFSPGMYKLNTITHSEGWHTALITNPLNREIYFISAIQVGGTDAANVPQNGELRVGTFVIADHTPMVF